MITKAYKLDDKDEYEGKKPWNDKYHTTTATHGEGQQFAKVGDSQLAPKSALTEGGKYSP